MVFGAKLGHLLLQTYLVTIGITWNQEPLDVNARYDRLEKLRHLASSNNLLLKEEARPVGVALFDSPSIVFHLGFDQANLAISGWYQDGNHPYVLAMLEILDSIAAMSEVNRLEFTIANGPDPLTGLQMQLDRHSFPKAQLPSTLGSKLELQVIYSFM